MRALMVLLTLFAMLAACDNAPKSTSQKANIDDLVKAMTGNFNSGAQEAADSSYYNISLKMAPIWTDKTGNEKYLYVEQALASNLEKPYRQRIYVVSQVSDSQFVSAVYSLQNPDTFIGQWANPTYFNQFDESVMEIREGCEVYLTKRDNTYTGSTKEKACKSTLRGASYASSIVTIEPDRVVSWDQGFDENGEQVWGAEKGGYIFMREKK